MCLSLPGKQIFGKPPPGFEGFGCRDGWDIGNSRMGLRVYRPEENGNFLSVLSRCSCCSYAAASAVVKKKGSSRSSSSSRCIWIRPEREFSLFPRPIEPGAQICIPNKTEGPKSLLWTYHISENHNFISVSMAETAVWARLQVENAKFKKHKSAPAVGGTQCFF